MHNQEREAAREQALLDGLYSLEDVMTGEFQPPEWLVHNMWQKGAYGLVSAPPKSFKSILMMDLAVSVASNTPFLGAFTTLSDGPVLVVAREDTIESLKTRVSKVLASRGLLGKIRHTDAGIIFEPERRPPIWFYTGPLDLGREKDQMFMERVLSQEIGDPALVIFDPWYRLFPTVNFNEAREVQPALDWLSWLARSQDTALVLVHHTKKAKDDGRDGAKTLGTIIFWGWVENALYIKRPDGRVDNVEIARDFRSVNSSSLVEAHLRLGSTFSLDYEVKVPKGPASERQLGMGMRKNLNREELGYYLNIPDTQLDRFLETHGVTL